jgi:hypothetical protein
MLQLLVILLQSNFAYSTESFLRLHQCDSAPIPISPAAKGKIMISIAFHFALDSDNNVTLTELYTVIDSYLNFKKWDIDFFFDINTPEAIEVINSKYPPKELPKGKHMTYQVWTSSDLKEIGDDPLSLQPMTPHYPFILAYAHRQYMHHYIEDYEFFIYSEHDMLLRDVSFDLYYSHYRELWEKNWLFNFYRYEVNSTGHKLMMEEPRNNPALLRTSSGKEYLWSTFTDYVGMWVLDQEQFRNFITTMHYKGGLLGPGFQWIRSPRERVAFGWDYADLDGFYRSRTAVLLTEKATLHPDAGVHHLSDKYASSLRYGPDQPNPVYVFDSINFDPLPCLTYTRPMLVDLQGV